MNSNPIFSNCDNILLYVCLRHHARCVAVLVLFIVLLASVCRAENKSIVISANKAEWRFTNPAIKFEIVQDYERNYDSPFAGKPKLIWSGKGVSDQTLVHDFVGDGQDISEYEEVVFWMQFEPLPAGSAKWQKLFKDGGGDGNVHILLWDKEGKIATAFIQSQVKEFGKWHKIVVSLKSGFQGLGGLDIKNIRSIGIGVNLLDGEVNATASYEVSFAEVEFFRFQQKSVAISKIHPGQFMPYQKVYLLKDYPSGLYIAMASTKDKEQLNKIKGLATLDIDMPKELSFRGVSGQLIDSYEIIKPQIELKCFNFAQMEDWVDRKMDINSHEITRDGQQYVRYSVFIEKSSLIKNLRSALDGRFSSGVNLYISTEASRKAEGQIFWRCDDIGLDWQMADYEVLPQLPKGPGPKRLVTVAWCGMELIPEELWPEMISLYKDAGFNTYTNSGWLSPRIKRLFALMAKNNIKIYEGGQSAIMASWFSTEPNDKSLWAYTEEGKINPWGVACLTYCAEEGEKFMETLAPFYQKAADYYPVNGLVNDYEMQGTTKLCYNCPRCMKAFAKYASLDAEILAPGLIREKYNDLFTKFHLEQNAQIAKNWIEIVRQKNPDLQAIICSGHVPYDSNSAVRYIAHSGTDPRLWDDVADQHWPMMYFNGYPLCKDIEKTVEVLKKPVVPILGSPWAVGLKKFTPDQTELNVLACLQNGAAGYGFYIGFVSWDAMFWDKLIRLSHLAAQIEDAILDGDDVTQNVNISGIASDVKCSLKVYKYKDKIVVGVINYSEKLVSPEIDLSKISLVLKEMKILYLKGADGNDVLLSGTKIRMNLDSEESVFVEL